MNKNFYSKYLFFIMVSFTDCSINLEDAESPILEIDQGFLKGFVASSRDGREYYAFLGVPYAKNPERFKWGVDKKPIIAWIHGGAFMFGSGQFYGPKYYLTISISFLSTGDEVMPGNNGLKDQSLALRFIKGNAIHFNGDPNKITISGNSAGAASVSYHLLSRASKGLFNGAILQSGFATNPWALQGHPRHNARRLGEELDCHTETSEGLIQCLERMELEDLIRGVLIFEKLQGEFYFPFGPTIEPKSSNSFMDEDPLKILRSGNFANNVPLIIGFNEDEGIILQTAKIANPKLLSEINNNFHQMAPQSLLYDHVQTAPAIATSNLRSFYFGNSQIDENSLQNLTNMYSDRYFIQGIHNGINLVISGGYTSVYPYIFGFHSSWSFTKFVGIDPILGVTHLDECHYLFNISFSKDLVAPEHDAFSERISKNFVNFFVEFAKNFKPPPFFPGAPTPLQSIRDQELEFYYIGHDGDPIILRDPYKERVEFWNKFLGDEIQDFYKKRDEL